MKKRIASFFDIDGTLYREGLITEMFKKLIKSQIIEPETWYNEVKDLYLKWDRRIGNYDDYLIKVGDLYIEAVKGLHKSQIEFIAKKVIKEKGDRVYTYTRDMIAWHKSQGHAVIAISGSPHELVREMAIKYKFDDFIATDYVLDKHEHYTGEITPMWDSASKRNAINLFVKRYHIDLNQSYAYGDTAGDFSMLKAVRYPTAINPTRELVNKLLENSETREKIKIVVERKDMIYKLDANSVLI